MTTDKQTDRQTNKQTDRQDKNNMPPIIPSGGIKTINHVVRTSLWKQKWYEKLKLQILIWWMIVLGIKTKSWDRSNWKIEWRRKRKLNVSEGSCRSCLPYFIAVVLDFDQRLLGYKDKTNNKKEIGKNPTFFKYLRAETSRAEMENGRNLWGSNPKRAEISGNPSAYKNSEMT